jgi:hypothetical protein
MNCRLDQLSYSSPLVRHTEPRSSLVDQLTVVINTSPATAHPTTRLIEEVVASFALVPGLSECRLIVVADGFKLRARYALKQGAVTEELSVAYSRYLRRLAALTRMRDSPLAGAELLILDKHHGCAHGLRRALSRVKTPFVLPIQHDRPFMNTFNLFGVLLAMQTLCDTVHYVGLPTALSLWHEMRVCSRGLSQSFFRERTCEMASVRFLPLAAFLDSSHIARVSWYMERVFGPTRHARLPRGCFLEDTLGQEQLRELRELGSSTHSWYGTYLLHSGLDQQALVSHLDGHDSRAGRSDWSKWCFSASHTTDEQWAVREMACAPDMDWVLFAERLFGYADEGSVDEFTWGSLTPGRFGESVRVSLPVDVPVLISAAGGTDTESAPAIHTDASISSLRGL